MAVGRNFLTVGHNGRTTTSPSEASPRNSNAVTGMSTVPSGLTAAGTAVHLKYGGSRSSVATRLFVPWETSVTARARQRWDLRTRRISSVAARKCGPPSNGSMRLQYWNPIRRRSFSTPRVSRPTLPTTSWASKGNREQ